jgi:hypothetical protein
MRGEKGVTVALADVVKLEDKSGGFFVGKVKCHSRADMVTTAAIGEEMYRSGGRAFSVNTVL